MKKMTMVLSIAVFCSLISFAQDKEFKRVEQFPKGIQIGTMSSVFLSGAANTHSEQRVFEVPYDKVWAATQRAARMFEKMGERPVISVDEQSGKVQNGKINQDSLTGRGSYQWMDEFVSEVTRLTSTLTKVTISRKVVQKVPNLRGVYTWQTVWSNGKIERWVLTQIEDEINNEGVDYSKSAPGKYIREKKPKDYFELKSDGTLYLSQGGKDYDGQYEVTGNTITFVMTKKHVVSYGKFQGNTIIDPEGERWVKQGGIPENSSTQVSTPISTPPAPSASASNPSSEVLTNTDIIRMIEAKLPDSVIITKIRNSTCKFDTSTDGLIKLKQAGVSDSVIQVMTEAPSK